MKATPITTHKITNKDTDIFSVIDKYLPKLSEKSVVAITSKIISICEGRIVLIQKVDKVGKVGEVDKDDLIKKEAEYYLPRSSSRYNVSLTIAKGILAASAGIDESNGNGYYVLWPKDPQKSANNIRSYLTKKYNLKHIGVIITDSKTTPLRWGVTGISLVHSGFRAVNSYIGKKDLFGRRFEFEKVNIADGLAAASALVMGEGKEQTPLAVIEDVSNVVFLGRNPTEKELEELHISPEDDLYGPLLKSVKWSGGKG